VGIFSEYEVLGSLDITCYDNYDYTISNSFDDHDTEISFFLFLADKVMANTSKSTDLDQMLASYFLEIGNSVEDLEDNFSQYTEVPKSDADIEYSVKQELRSKSDGSDSHLYINTSFNAFWSLSEEWKSVNSTLLYAMDMRDRFKPYKFSVLGDRFTELLRYYDENGPPSTTTLTEGPSSVVEKYN
jgi:protein subunit release factor A